MTTANNIMKRTAALIYLRERGIYILDGVFKPTVAAATDVAATIRRFNQGNKPKLIRIKS